MDPAGIAFFEKLVGSSPPLLVLSLFVVWVLWRKLEKREAAMDELSLRTVNAMHEVTEAVKDLTAEIRANR